MTPLLLAPLGLAALAALIVPLLIHLRRRTEEVPIEFAAMRWLEALPRPRRKLQLDELFLLALRLLLIALLALLLAGPAVLGWDDKGPRIIAAPGIDPDAARKLVGPDVDIRWIAPGFPDIDTPPQTGPAALSSLIRQYDAELPPGADLTILVPQVLSGVDAEPLRLTRKVTWRVVESDDLASEPAAPVNPILSVRHPAQQDRAVRYFRAAAEAWSDTPEFQTGRFEASTDTALPPRDHVLVWLVPGPIPQPVTDWVSKGGTALIDNAAEVAMPAASESLWSDGAGRTLVEGGAMGAGRLMRFTRPLVPADMPDLLAPEFAARLRDLVARPAPPPMRVSAAAFTPATGRAPFKLPPRDLSSWLAAVIALVFLAERMLATRRRRFPA